MKEKYQKLVITVFTFFLVTGCSVLQEKAAYRSASLRNINPAPKSMAIPAERSEKAPIIDDVHLRTTADYHYSLGESLSMEGQSAQAIEQFKLTLVYDPDSAEVRLRLAAEYLRQGSISEAIELAQESVKINPKSTDARHLLGGLYTSIKMYEKAKLEYLKILEIDKNNPQAYIFLGALLSEEGKFKEAEKHFKDLAKNKEYKKPHLVHYYLGKMYVSWGPKKYKLAEASFSKSLSLKPKSVDVVTALANLYEKKKQKAKAIKLFHSFQDQYGPRKSMAAYLADHYLGKEDLSAALVQLEYLESFDDKDLNIKVRIALALIELKRFQPAVDKLRGILDLAPKADKIRFYLAAVYEEVKDHNEAVRNYKMIPVTSEYYADAMIHAAYIYKDKNKLDEATEMMRVAIENRQDSAKAFTFYASLLDAQKKHKEAFVVMNKAKKIFSENKQVFFFLGSVADKLDKKQIAVESMRKVLEIDANYVQAINYLAYLYAEMNVNLDDALRLAQKAIKLQPEDPYVLDTLGWVLYKRKNYKSAVRYLEAAHKVKPDESIVAEHLGDVYYQAEFEDKAKKMYIKAMNLEKDYVKKQQIQTKITSIDRQQGVGKMRTPASE